VGTNQSLAGRLHPPEHLAVWNTSVRRISSGTLPSGTSRLEHHSRKSLGITMPHGLRLDVKLLELHCSSGRNVNHQLELPHSCTTGRVSP
jgi:hypothetical protein